MFSVALSHWSREARSIKERWLEIFISPVETFHIFIFQVIELSFKFQEQYFVTHCLFTLQRQQNCKIQTVLPKPDRPRIFPWISSCKTRPIFAISQEPPARHFATAREYFSSFKLCVVPDLGNLRPCKWWQLKDILLMIQPIYFTLDLIIIKDPMVRICAVSIPYPPWRTWINK